MKMKLYIAVLDQFPDYMTPTLVAHTVLSAHLAFTGIDAYDEWLNTSFRKCVVRVSQREFDCIAAIPRTVLGYERNTLDGKSSCGIPLPCDNDQIPKVLRFAKLWAPL
jgi:hypothetical protein